MKRLRVGLLLQGLGYEYQNEILMGASAESERLDVDLICFSGGDVGLGKADYRNVIYALATTESVDGVVIAAGSMSQTRGPAEFDVLRERLQGLPIVGLSAELEGMPAVLIDNAVSVRLLTEHLIDVHGRRRVAFIEGMGAESDARLAGYLEAMRSRGLEPGNELRAKGNFHRDVGIAAVNRWLLSGESLPDAIVAANDWMALGAIEALTEHGIRVPEDVPVVGFDDIDEARFRVPSLTTVRQPSWQLGVIGVRSVVRALAGERIEPLQTLPTVPQIRRSCGCFAGSTRETLDGEQSTKTSPGVKHRSACAKLLEANAPSVGKALPEDWPEQLAAALARDLERGTHMEFASTLERHVAAAAHLGNVSAWHGMVLALGEATASSCPDCGAAEPREALARIRERAHIVIGAQAERVQGERRLLKEDLLRRLSELSGGVRSATNHDQLREALLTHLPALGIRRAFVAVHLGSLQPDSTAELLLGYERDEGELPGSRGCHFRAGDLSPKHLQAERRTSMIAIPAAFQGTESLGFFLAELSAVDGSVYESLRDQLSVALNGTELLRTLVQEATLRERAERARLEGELDIARSIQSAVLPKTMEVAGLELAGLMVPATEIGGDYFDVLPFAGGSWLSIGDVAGHGLQAGLEMIMLQSMMAALVEGQPSADPLEVWRRLNSVLTQNTRSRLATNDHVTLSILRYAADGSVVGVGAHEDIAVHRARTGRCEFVPTPGVWAGVMTNPPASVVQRYGLQLEPGDVMVLYTDGLIETRNAKNELFGPERLASEIEAQHALAPSALCQHLYDVAASWAVHRDDDVSLIVARYLGVPPEGMT